MAGRTSRPAGVDARPSSPAGREPRARPHARADRRGPAAPSAPADPALDAEADPESVARAIALGLLERSPRTRAELAAAMARRGVPDEVAAAVLDRFGEVGLVDDAAFAAAWVDTRHTGRGLARRALAAELRRRGVDEQTARDALSAVTPDDELAAAQALVARRLATTARLSPDARVRRLVSMLARKGFAPGLAYRVVRDALGAEPVGSPVPDESV